MLSPLASRHSPLFFTPASPPASQHSMHEIECCLPHPRITIAGPSSSTALDIQAGSHSRPLRSHWLGLVHHLALRQTQLSRKPHLLGLSPIHFAAPQSRRRLSHKKPVHGGLAQSEWRRLWAAEKGASPRILSCEPHVVCGGSERRNWPPC